MAYKTSYWLVKLDRAFGDVSTSCSLFILYIAVTGWPSCIVLEPIPSGGHYALLTNNDILEKGFPAAFCRYRSHVVYGLWYQCTVQKMKVSLFRRNKIRVPLIRCLYHSTSSLRACWWCRCLLFYRFSHNSWFLVEPGNLALDNCFLVRVLVMTLFYEQEIITLVYFISF